MVYNGNYGVTIFFVISGFLITRNSLSRWGSLEKIDWRHFYFLRCTKILPPLLLVLSVIVLLGVLDIPSFTNKDNGHALGGILEAFDL